MVYAENILICIAVPLAISVLYIRGSARRFIISFLVGMTTCLLGAYISGFFQNTSGFPTEEVSIFISPVVEEMLKLMPVMLFIYVFESASKEVLHVAVGIGAGFATFENCCCILSSGSQNFGFILIRGSAVGVMHIVTMAVLTFGLYILKRHNIFSFPGIVGSLSLSMTFHALYNLLVSKPGISSYLGYTLPLISAILLYLVYQQLKTVEEISDKFFQKG